LPRPAAGVAHETNVMYNPLGEKEVVSPATGSGWLRERGASVPVCYTLQEVCRDMCALHRTYIGGIKRGKRNVAIVNMENIARAPKVSLSALFRGV